MSKTRAIALNWRESWKGGTRFRIVLITGILALPVSMHFFSIFLQQIEMRNGVVLDDIVLRSLPAMDLSIPIFSILWLTIGLLVWQSFYSPKLFLTYIWGLVFISITRTLSIYLIPLDAPLGLIGLEDPLVSMLFYSGGVITKDLFYSGHAASMMLAYFVFEKKYLKVFALAGTIAISFMLMIQHVHYFVDIIFVPFITYGIYKFCVWFLKFR